MNKSDNSCNKEQKINKRNSTIDILKFFGILLIMLAHVSPPKLIFQLRNFDVVLLVILSGILAVTSYKKCDNLVDYFKKRIIRLVIPVWIFLTVFFSGCGMLSLILDKGYPFSFKSIISSYTLLNGIGYVWIIRVYILCAISVPILYKMKEKLPKYYIGIILIYVLYEIIYYFIGDMNLFLKYIVYYIIPYGFICTLIGIEIKEWKNNTILCVAIILVIVFMLQAIFYYCTENALITTNEAKYPARAYYLSYAIGISMFCYYLIDRKNIFNIKNKLNNAIVIFISTHTMWIYLWHIIYIYCINYLFTNIFWIYKFVIITILSIITTYIQSKIVNKLNLNNKTIKSILDC